MIVEIRGIKAETKPLEIHLDSMRVNEVKEGESIISTCFTAVTEEGQVLALYLPKGKGYTQVGWKPK